MGFGLWITPQLLGKLKRNIKRQIGGTFGFSFFIIRNIMTTPIEYRCTNQECRALGVRPIKGTFWHPHLGEQPCKVCPKCGKPVRIK